MTFFKDLLHTLSLLWKEVKAQDNYQTFHEDEWEMSSWYQSVCFVCFNDLKITLMALTSRLE